jgi:hypothetical protein
VFVASKRNKRHNREAPLAVWPEGPQQKFHKKLIINFADKYFFLFNFQFIYKSLDRIFVKNRVPWKQ